MTPAEPSECLYGAQPDYRILEGIQDAVLVLDEDGRVIWANAGFARLSGYTSTEIAGTERFFDLIPSEDERRRLQEYNALRREDPLATPENYSISFLDRSGNVHIVEIAIGLIPGTARSVIVLSDVTGQNRGEQALQITEARTEITEWKKAERELLIGRMAVESSFAAIAIADLDGYITHVNPALLALGGLTDPGEVIGRHITEFWVDPARVERVLAKFAERGRCNGKLVGRKADGTEFTAHITAALLRDDSGNPICIMATAVDISKEMQMARALRESEERYRTLTELAPDVIFLIDTEGNALYVNSAGGRLLGVDPEGLRSKNHREVFPPDVTKRWLSMIRTIAASPGETLTEETHLPGDGGGIWLETHLFPMAERDGAVRRLLGISRDVTGRKRAEEQLRFQAQVLSQVEDAVIAADTDERITYMNRAAERLYGVPSGEALGRSTSELFTIGWLRPGDEEAAKNALRSSGTWRGVVGHRKRDGEVISVDETLSTLTDDSGRVTGTLHSLRDVTGQRQAELELRIKDMAIASALEGISLSDYDGRIIYANRASLAIHGWEEEEIIGQHVSVLWADPGEMNQIGEKLIRDGAWSGEVKSRRKDGSTFPMQLFLSVVTDEAGRRICTMGSGIEITERKQAEQELRIRDMAIASSLSAFAVADLDGRLIYVNRAFLSMWGYDSPTEVIGKRVTELWQNEEESRSAFENVVRTGRHTGERIGRRRDETTFYAMFSGSLVRDGDGVPLCITASLTDITSQKQAEAEIQAHNRELSILNRIIGVSASATDVDEVLERVLAAILSLLDLSGGGIYLIEPGRERARLVCVQSLPDGFSPQPCIPDITVQPYVEVLVAGNPLFFDDHPDLRYPGEGTPHQYASIPITAHGKVIGALNVVSGEGKRFTAADRSILTAIGREIGTSVERTLLIRQLEMAEREANLYLDILGHDIRNAENVSGLYADLLVDMLEGKGRDHAQKLQSSIRKSVEILRNVSTIRRIHKESAVLVPVDLDGVIRDEIAIFPGSRIRYGGTNLAVMADALLPEVFTNLIGNAIKFGGAEVEVTIRVEENDGEVMVVVEDTGPGIPDAMKDAIFMRFGQSRNCKSGQGLGLYITRMLITRYGGRVWVGDRAPGRPECGAVFRFTLKKA